MIGLTTSLIASSLALFLPLGFCLGFFLYIVRICVEISFGTLSDIGQAFVGKYKGIKEYINNSCLSDSSLSFWQGEMFNFLFIILSGGIFIIFSYVLLDGVIRLLSLFGFILGIILSLLLFKKILSVVRYYMKVFFSISFGSVLFTIIRLLFVFVKCLSKTVFLIKTFVNKRIKLKKCIKCRNYNN